MRFTLKALLAENSASQHRVRSTTNVSLVSGNHQNRIVPRSRPISQSDPHSGHGATGPRTPGRRIRSANSGVKGAGMSPREMSVRTPKPRQV